MNMAGARRWDNYPYYDGPCESVDGAYERDDDRCDRTDRCDRCDRPNRCGRRGRNGIFSGYLPMAVAANGMIPLVAGNPCRKDGFDVNSGLITVREGGTYLATVDVRIPAGATLSTTVTLDVDGASQSTAVTQIDSTGTAAYTAQAIFQADEGAIVSLRSSDAISLIDPSAQPLVTLSLVELD